MSNERQTGTIIFYDPKKGFGFIKIDGPEVPDLFYHIDNFDSDRDPVTDDRLRSWSRMIRDGLVAGARRWSPLSNNNWQAALAPGHVCRTARAVCFGRPLIECAAEVLFGDVDGDALTSARRVTALQPTGPRSEPGCRTYVTPGNGGCWWGCMPPSPLPGPPTAARPAALAPYTWQGALQPHGAPGRYALRFARPYRP
jgi:cold shock CspA family protein